MKKNKAIHIMADRELIAKANKDLTPIKTAKILIKDKFPIEKYEALQEHRRERLKTFEKHKIDILIKEAKKLIAYGDKVLKEMKKVKP
jgi:hypothetical protein